ncbi:hypothetical protein WN944_022145 [Citrus x changshan-huyou]|uniref:Uncharacterized protein n=1 Tax=Citrus x changshan-huyou TaxID=2935761 RepID=A0AAP0R318_9ROSI
MDQKKNLSLAILYLVILGALTDQSTAVLKRYQRCAGTCYVDCLCVSHQVAPYFCHYYCGAKCAKCFFKHCKPTPLPPPTFSCHP